MGLITKLHKMLADREISSRELTEKYLQAIERDNNALNAYVKITAEEALKAADEADRKISAGEDTDLLCGIPVTLKDNISTKGIETTCCSEMLRGFTPIYDATVWQTMKRKGSVLLGKTNMDEFAMGNSCETSCFGAAKNPYNKALVAGGSSGGGASAVAGNLAPFALGSDTGGSVRQPASFCGLVGLKPTYGALSRYGLIAYASSLDQIGTLTTTVEDASAVFDSIAGHDPLDSTSKHGYKPNTFSSLDNDIKGKVVGVPEEYLQKLRPEVLSAFENAVKTYEALGARVEYIRMPSLDFALPAYYILACAEASSNLGRYDGVRFGHKTELYDSVHDMVCKSRSEGFGDEVKRRILMGTYVLSEGYFNAYYKKAQDLRHAVVHEFKKAFERCDVIMTPTVPHTAFELRKAVSDPVESYQSDLCTVPVNIAALPALSLPCGYSPEGLPIGLQLIGDSFREDEILNFAYKFQQATGFVRTADWGLKL